MALLTDEPTATPSTWKEGGREASEVSETLSHEKDLSEDHLKSTSEPWKPWEATREPQVKYLQKTWSCVTLAAGCSRAAEPSQMWRENSTRASIQPWDCTHHICLERAAWQPWESQPRPQRLLENDKKVLDTAVLATMDLKLLSLHDENRLIKDHGLAMSGGLLKILTLCKGHGS